MFPKTDTQTQEFLDLYVDGNKKNYIPSLLTDVEGNLAMIKHLDEVCQSEQELLSKIAHYRFR